MSIDTAIARLRKLFDNPSPHPDDVKLDLEGTIYELLAVKERAEAAEAEARRYRWLRHGDNDERVLQFYDTDNCGTDDCWLLRGEDLDAAIDAELAKECKCNLRTKLVGDGCEVCNPELAAELAKEPKP